MFPKAFIPPSIVILEEQMLETISFNFEVSANIASLYMFTLLTSHTSLFTQQLSVLTLLLTKLALKFTWIGTCVENE
jgi:hypothetical protein